MQKTYFFLVNSSIFSVIAFSFIFFLLSDLDISFHKVTHSALLLSRLCSSLHIFLGFTKPRVCSPSLRTIFRLQTVWKKGKEKKKRKIPSSPPRA